MPFRCDRCEEKDLRCFVDTASGRCAGCIAARAECNLFVSEEEWEKVEDEEREKRLEVARLKVQAAEAGALLAKSEAALLEVESRKRLFARRDRKLLQAQEQREVVESAIPPIPVSDPSADSGGSQANVLLLDPSLDHLLNDFFVDDPLLSPGSFSDCLDLLL